MNNKNLKDKLLSEVVSTSWLNLIDHHKRKAVFIVDKSIDLAQVAVDVATDNVGNIKEYQSKNLLIEPSKEQVTKWDNNKNEIIAKIIIVQPYVFIQLI